VKLPEARASRHLAYCYTVTQLQRQLYTASSNVISVTTERSHNIIVSDLTLLHYIN